METVRAVLLLSLVTGTALTTRNVASGPATEHLITGTATPRGAVLVAGDDGAHYQLKGGSIIDIGAGAEFSLSHLSGFRSARLGSVTSWYACYAFHAERSRYRCRTRRKNRRRSWFAVRAE
jgi:hypothetical protein